MEKYKVAYLMGFIARFEIDLEKFVSILKEMKETIRCCYAESSWRSMSSDDFVKMILLDAIFILELFLRYSTGSWDRDDPVLRNQWMLPLLKLDLALLENQLPFFLLEKLYNLAIENYSNFNSLFQLTSEFFNDYNVQWMLPRDVKIEHFTDLIRTLQLPLSTSRSKLHMRFVTLRYSATQLHDSGVKFRKSTSSKCLLDIHFKKRVLEMPRLVLDDQTEALVRNVMALEQFCQNNVYLTDYFIFLYSLINTIEDINSLCDKGILVNHLDDNKAALSLVKNLITNITWSGVNSDFTKICEDFNKFYKKPFH